MAIPIFGPNTLKHQENQKLKQLSSTREQIDFAKETLRKTEKANTSDLTSKNESKVLISEINELIKDRSLSNEQRNHLLSEKGKLSNNLDLYEKSKSAEQVSRAELKAKMQSILDNSFSNRVKEFGSSTNDFLIESSRLTGVAYGFIQGVYKLVGERLHNWLTDEKNKPKDKADEEGFIPWVKQKIHNTAWNIGNMFHTFFGGELLDANVKEETTYQEPTDKPKVSERKSSIDKGNTISFENIESNNRKPLSINDMESLRSAVELALKANPLSNPAMLNIGLQQAFEQTPVKVENLIDAEAYKRAYNAQNFNELGTGSLTEYASIDFKKFRDMSINDLFYQGFIEIDATKGSIKLTESGHQVYSILQSKSQEAADAWLSWIVDSYNTQVWFTKYLSKDLQSDDNSLIGKIFNGKAGIKVNDLSHIEHPVLGSKSMFDLMKSELSISDRIDPQTLMLALTNYEQNHSDAAGIRSLMYSVAFNKNLKSKGNIFLMPLIDKKINVSTKEFIKSVDSIQYLNELTLSENESYLTNMNGIDKQSYLSNVANGNLKLGPINTYLAKYDGKTDNINYSNLAVYDSLKKDYVKISAKDKNDFIKITNTKEDSIEQLINKGLIVQLDDNTLNDYTSSVKLRLDKTESVSTNVSLASDFDPMDVSSISLEMNNTEQITNKTITPEIVDNIVPVKQPNKESEFL